MDSNSALEALQAFEMQSQNEAPVTFLSLPTEIKAKIWAYAGILNLRKAVLSRYTSRMEMIGPMVIPSPLLTCRQLRSEFLECVGNKAIIQVGYHPMRTNDDDAPNQATADAPDQARYSNGVSLCALNPLALSFLDKDPRNNLESIFVEYDTRCHPHLLGRLDPILAMIFDQTTNGAGILQMESLPEVQEVSLHIKDLWWGDQITNAADIVYNKWGANQTNSNVNFPMEAFMRFLGKLPALEKLWVSGAVFGEPLADYLTERCPNITVIRGHSQFWESKLPQMAETDSLDMVNITRTPLSVGPVIPLPEWLRRRLTQHGPRLSPPTDSSGSS